MLYIRHQNFGTLLLVPKVPFWVQHFKTNIMKLHNVRACYIIGIIGLIFDGQNFDDDCTRYLCC